MFLLLHGTSPARGQAGMRCTFPTAVHPVLCFAHVARTVLISLMLWLSLSSAGPASGLSVQHPLPQEGQRCGGDTARTGDQKDIQNSTT